MSASEYQDQPLETGLDKRTYATGRVVFRSMVYVGGKRDFDQWEDITVTEAKALHLERKNKIKNELKTVRSKKLLGEIRDEAFVYYEACIANDELVEKPLSEGSFGNYKTAWPKRISKFIYKGRSIDELPLRDFDRPVALLYLRWLVPLPGVTSSTKNGTVSALRTVLRYARDAGEMTVDPFHGIPKTEFPSQKASPGFEARVLSGEESLRLIEAARSEDFRKTQHTSNDYADAVVCLVGGGQRIMELLGNRWMDIDLTDEIVHTRGQRSRGSKQAEATFVPTTKSRGENGGPRETPMLDVVYEAYMRTLEREQAKDRGELGDWVFTDELGKPLGLTGLAGAVKRAALIAGLGHVTPKNLRSSYCTALAHAGVPSVEAAASTGHSPEVFDRHYAKPIRDKAQRRENVSRLQRYGWLTERQEA